MPQNHSLGTQGIHAPHTLPSIDCIHTLGHTRAAVVYALATGAGWWVYAVCS